MNRRYLVSYSGMVAFTVLLAFVAGYLARDLVGYRNASFPVLEQAHNILSNHGFEALPAAPALEYGMIRGMVTAYDDPYTSFVEPVAHELETDRLEGSFGGIGVRLVRGEDGGLLLYPFPEGPAFMAGIRDADLLTQVEDQAVTIDDSIEAITAAIRGQEGTTVRITVERSGEPGPLQFRIQRRAVPLPSVTWHLAPENTRVGIVEVNHLADSTADEIGKAIEDLQSGGARFFILDLRDNGGGLLESGVEVARLFLPEGVVMEQQYRDAEVEQFRVHAQGRYSDLPITILVNGNTASAAEIVAGALQQAGRAQLIGESTFGKDSIQLVFELDDGSSLHVTAAKWWVPGLDPPIEDNGLIPDTFVQPGEGEVDVVVQAAIELLEAK